jgi:hypothetical protein
MSDRPGDGKPGMYLFFYPTREDGAHSRHRPGPQHLAFIQPSRSANLSIEVMQFYQDLCDRMTARVPAALRDKLGDAFVHGYVLHFGDIPLAFGDRLTAIPISYLWQAG